MTPVRPDAAVGPLPVTPRSGPRWRGALLYALGAVWLGSVLFYYRQNAGQQLGGPISLEKILWLNYALTAWFVLPAFLARHPAVAHDLRAILASFLASMVARGGIELLLLYVTLGWSPLYGITHDVFNILLISGLRAWGPRPRLGRPAAPADSFNRHVRRFCTTLQLGMAAEIVFAALFYRMAVHRDAVYFAAPTGAFAHINALTRWVDVAVYADLAWLLWRQRGTLFRRPDGAR